MKLEHLIFHYITKSSAIMKITHIYFNIHECILYNFHLIVDNYSDELEHSVVAKFHVYCGL